MIPKSKRGLKPVEKKTPDSVRYYLHGDAKELDRDLYYCAFCDAFQPRSHFTETIHEARYDGDHQSRYKRSRDAWKVIRSKNRARITRNIPQLYRPMGALNLIGQLPASEKARTGRFYRWLKRQAERDDPIGDLGGDVQRDRTYPAGTDSLPTIRKYLLHRRVSDEVLQALEEAYQEFKSKTRRRSGLSLKLRFEVFRADDYKCRICGASGREGARLEVDHKVAVSKGGTDERANLWTLCFKCNQGKGAANL